MCSFDSVQPDCTVGLEGASLGNFIAQSICHYTEQTNAEHILTKPLNHQNLQNLQVLMIC